MNFFSFKNLKFINTEKMNALIRLQFILHIIILYKKKEVKIMRGEEGRKVNNGIKFESLRRA